MITIKRCFLLLGLLLTSPGLLANVFKCTDANGEVVFQDRPCNGGDELRLDMLFGERQHDMANTIVQGSWCEVGTSRVLDGTLYRDNVVSRTWVFSENQMTQHVQQGQRQDTFSYPIRQAPGQFVVDHPTFGSGQVNWQVRRHNEQELVLAAYGDFTHLTPGECEMSLVTTN